MTSFFCCILRAVTILLLSHLLCVSHTGLKIHEKVRFVKYEINVFIYFVFLKTERLNRQFWPWFGPFLVKNIQISTFMVVGIKCLFLMHIIGLELVQNSNICHMHVFELINIHILHYSSISTPMCSACSYIITTIFPKKNWLQLENLMALPIRKWRLLEKVLYRLMVCVLILLHFNFFP